LLGALERQRFVRVGGQKEIDVDVRVVSATNRDLRAEINAGAFRLDLYYRIAVVTLQLPALRERPQDIPPLIEHFAKLAGHDGSLSDLVSHETVEELKRYRWPGNVRELRNWVEATLAIGEAPELDDRLTGESSPDALYSLTYKDARAALLEGFEKDYCARLIERASGNVSEAARQARMDRSYLIKLLQKHDLK
jgi:DNA-binding NtrC family response regulator